jgi:UrcA family protein
MAFKNILISGAVAAVLGVPLLASSGPALAQEQIIVRPPFSMHENETPLKGGMKTSTIMVSRTVGYDDLDLSKSSDRARLNRRIDIAAHIACRELDNRFPPSVYVPVSGSEDCVGNARREALAMADIPRYQPEYGPDYDEAPE